MDQVSKFIFLFLIGTTLLNFTIAMAARWKTRHKEFNLLIYYWLSLFLNFGVAAALSKNSTQIALSFIFQFLPGYIGATILAKSRGMKLNHRLLWGAQGAGTFLCIFFLLFTDFGFTISLLPLVASSILPFVGPMYNTLISQKEDSNWIEKGMAYIMAIGSINHFNFAVFRLDEAAAWWGWGISLASFQGFSVFLPLLINFRREEKEKKNIQQTLEKISGQNSNINLEIDELYAHLESQIAQKEELYQKLEASNSRLEEEREMNEILIRTVSHDLANPLTVINAYVIMLHGGKIPDDDKDRIWNRTKQNIQSALNMIGRIRNAILTRTQADLVAIHDVSVDTSIRKLIDGFETKLNDKQIKVRYFNGVPLDVFVAAEENCLTEHIFSNILSNAIKFSFENSEIHISVTEREDFVDVEFRDFGKGIEDTRLNKRLLGSTQGTSGETGTGFGLMVMGYFLRKFGAVYSLKSQTSGPERGTLIKISLRKSHSENIQRHSSLFRSAQLYS